MARFTFNLPDIGEGIAEAEIVAWHIGVGDMVEEDQQIADMMTDKATVEMESPVSGRVLEVAGNVGDVIAIGSMLVVLEVEGDLPDEDAEGVEEAQAAPVSGAKQETELVQESEELRSEEENGQDDPEPSDESQGQSHSDNAEEQETSRLKVLASPAVRARAIDLGIDLAEVKPASDGRVRHADLDAFLSYNGGYAAIGQAPPDEEIRVIGLRKRIAQNMAAAKRHIPHFSYVEECDVTELERLRAQLNAARGDRPKLTMLPLLIAAICKIIPQFPMINASYDDEANVITRHGAVHLGMATQTDAGLMVPVIRNAQGQNLWQLAREIVRLADAARTGKATSGEMQGGTLTITSLGPLGGVATTPVINRPEVAIIGPNRIVERPMYVADGMGGERIEKRKLMNISISCDHRVVDGYDAANFIQHLKRLIETPAGLLIAG